MSKCNWFDSRLITIIRKNIIASEKNYQNGESLNQALSRQVCLALVCPVLWYTHTEVFAMFFNSILKADYWCNLDISYLIFWMYACIPKSRFWPLLIQYLKRRIKKSRDWIVSLFSSRLEGRGGSWNYSHRQTTLAKKQEKWIPFGLASFIVHIQILYCKAKTSTLVSITHTYSLRIRHCPEKCLFCFAVDQSGHDFTLFALCTSVKIDL